MLAVLLLVVIAGGYLIVDSRDPDVATFCTADGLISEDGQIYGRDHAQDCAFVDDEGNKLPLDEEGRPIPP